MTGHRAALATFLGICLAAAGAEAQTPSWCKDAKEKVNVSDYDWKNFDGDDARYVLTTVVGAYCFPNEDSKRDAKIVAAGFEKWTKKLDMTEADWADAVAYSNERGQGSLYHRDAKLAWSSWSPIDQYLGIGNSDRGDSSAVSDHAYVADAVNAKLSELGRAGFIDECTGGSDDAPVTWAICQPDIDALDRTKVAAELRGDNNYPGHIKMLIRLELLGLWDRLEKHAEKVKAVKAKDPAYAKMFELAAAARKEWATAADPRLLELVAAMDDARVTNSRRLSEGCKEKTYGAFRGVVGAMPASTFGELEHDIMKQKAPALEQAMGIVVGTPNGYLASLATYLCGRFDEKRDYLIRTLGDVMQRWPGYRGPRNAAHLAILTANLQLDDRDARIEYPDVSRPWLAGGGGSSGGGWGDIASVKVSGETATISFAKVKSKQQECTNGSYTNRLRQIRSDGTLVYEYKCKSWKTVTINEPPFDSQTVNARYAQGLKKGMMVYVVEDVVTLAYPKAGSPPFSVAGVQLK